MEWNEWKRTREGYVLRFLTCDGRREEAISWVVLRVFSRTDRKFHHSSSSSSSSFFFFFFFFFLFVFVFFPSSRPSRLVTSKWNDNFRSGNHWLHQLFSSVLLVVIINIIDISISIWLLLSVSFDWFIFYNSFFILFGSICFSNGSILRIIRHFSLSRWSAPMFQKYFRVSWIFVFFFVCFFL